MSDFSYRTFIVVLVLITLSLSFLLIYSNAGSNHYCWRLSCNNCRGILAIALPLLKTEGVADNAFEPWGIISHIWSHFWQNKIKDPHYVLQGEIPFYKAYERGAFDRPAPAEITTVTAKLHIDKHLYLPRTPASSAKVAIIHTHTSETYCNDMRPKDKNSLALPAGKARGQVVEVGNRLASQLENKGIATVHDSTIYDGIYSMAYIEARQGIKRLLAAHPDLLLIFDIHRDGLEHLGRDAVTSEIDGKTAATVMFVVSEEWGPENLKMAGELAEYVDKKYSGLLRRLEIRKKQCYNQDLHPGCILVEIGGVLNTLEEALYTADLLSEVISDYMNKRNRL